MNNIRNRMWTGPYDGRFYFRARRLALILAVLFSAAVMAACGSGNTGNGAGTAGATAAPTQAGAAIEVEPTQAEASPTATAEPATETAEPVTEEPSVPTATAGEPASTLPSEATPTAAPARPAAFPDPAGYSWQPVYQGLDSPLGMAYAAEPGRLYLVEKTGRILVAENDQVLPEPFLDLRGRVSQGSEQGLLGLAFHPDFAENGYFYLNYTDQNGDTHIARFQVDPQDPNRALPDSETTLLTLEQPFGNHNGGVVTFGPDGYLYLGLGDGGSAGDPQGNGQSLDTLLGKILRLDVDGGEPYGIPPGNPFQEGEGRPEIWAYGLRNPWRIAFDRATGDLYIADVGQNNWEEIDFLPAGHAGGANFGWNYLEGSHIYEAEPPTGLPLIGPVAEYNHSQGCSVTGGEVYRGQALPEWQGVYFYGDYCSGTVWGLLHKPEGGWETRPLFTNMGRITSFGTDSQGEVYLIDQNGTIFRLTGN